VTSFEAGRYGEAAMAFASAMEMAPEDRILPFAYAQALFASQQYSDAAKVLRMALQNVSPDEQGVFYPRGLYGDDDVLFGQIETLLDKVETFGFDGDLQLLLGYHLLGVGETEYARTPLEQAGRDLNNAAASKVLLDLLNKIKAESTESNAQTQADVGGAIGATEPAAGAAVQPAAPSGTARTDVLKRMDANATSSGNATGVTLDAAAKKEE
jgi:tetratricopeptide (TPR) repeat protein